MEICSVFSGSTANITRRRYSGRDGCSTCAEPSSSSCDHYRGTATTVWPCQNFPAAEFTQRYSAAGLRDAKTAWATYEHVEAYDAAVRVRLSGTGWNPSSSPCKNPWYHFAGAAEYTAYKRGRELHTELCPGLSWVSQRTLGISSVPVTDVRPGYCCEII